MTPGLTFSAVVALSVALSSVALGASSHPKQEAVAPYKHYFEKALRNPDFGKTTRDLHKMKIKNLKIYSACIGELVGATACPRADYFFGCAFADAHPSNPDSAAARRICAEHASAQYAVQRITVYRGDRCGYIIDTVTCAF
jgi:hypothetical protein